MKPLRRRLWVKLTLAFVLVALVGVVLVAILANRAATMGFARYLQFGERSSLQQLQRELEQFYAAQGSWQGVSSVLRESAAGPQGGTGYFLRVVDSEGRVMASRGGQSREVIEFDQQLPLIVDGQQIGNLLAEPAGGSGRAGEQYLSSVNQAILWAGLVALLLALFLAMFLSRRLTRPLSRLTEAARAVAAGELEQQVPVSSSDELGQLARDFNRMAGALALSERQRRQLLADTAHDLRTPISVIRTHLEAMLDGVFPATPENLAAIHEETVQLSRLVEDVRLLSLAETGHLPLEKEAVDMGELAGQVVAAFAPLADIDGVRLESSLRPTMPIYADAARIRQALANLIANALRYAPLGSSGSPAVKVTVAQAADAVLLQVRDKGPGLTPEQRERVFDRFWRSDGARERRSGGSGLGLAITKSIVEAHGGLITVEAVLGEGTTFTITLPTSRGEEELTTREER